jgi:hypothetical protein
MALMCPILSRCDFINRRNDNILYRTLLECELKWSTGGVSPSLYTHPLSKDLQIPGNSSPGGMKFE